MEYYLIIQLDYLMNYIDIYWNKINVLIKQYKKNKDGDIKK